MLFATNNAEMLVGDRCTAAWRIPCSDANYLMHSLVIQIAADLVTPALGRDLKGIRGTGAKDYDYERLAGHPDA